MPLQLDVCADGDMPRAFTILSLAFAHEHPYFDYVFPKHDTPGGRKVGGERILAFKKADPNTTFIKVTDTDTGTIIGVAKWNVYKGVVPDEVEMEGDYWDSEQDKKLAQEMWAGYLMPRRRAIKDMNGNLVCTSSVILWAMHRFPLTL